MAYQHTLGETKDGKTKVSPPGMIKCYITGKNRKSTPEEKVRQEVAKSLVHEYGYDIENIDIEFPIKMGRATKRADIVVFNRGKKHRQENVFLIAEVKQERVKATHSKQGVQQLSSYISACPNCEFGLWVGNERLAFSVKIKQGTRSLGRIPDIPKSGRSSILVPTRSSLAPAVGLKQVFRRIHNYIYANQGLQKDKAFEELQKLIFIKVYDEQFNPSLQFYVLPHEEPGDVRKRLHNVFKHVQKLYKYIFTGDEKIELNDQILAYATAELQRFSLVDTKTDVKGEAYEEIVGPNLRGDRGEFFTPRNVCDMIIDMLFFLIKDERLTSPGGFSLLDPAAGTGGFLISGTKFITSAFSKMGVSEARIRESVRDIVDVNFYGMDFNPFLVRVAQMNMVMHGDGSSNISHANSLANPSTWEQNDIHDVRFGQFDIVATNPPFGTKARINDPEILEDYEIAEIKASKRGLPPELLFIERCIRFLKPGGVLGIVLPDSILTNPSLEWIRNWILEKTYILSSIDLPSETFQPYTGTQTSVLILKKDDIGDRRRKNSYEIFMAIPKRIGHDQRGNPVYRTTSEGEVIYGEDGNPIIADDLRFVSNEFKKWAKEHGMVK